MDWRPRLASALLTYALALLTFYPFLLFHFLQHHGEPLQAAVVQASFGDHSVQALAFAIPFLLIGLGKHRLILGAHAGPAVLLPTFVAAGLSFLLVAFGPPQALAAGFLTSLLAFAGALYMTPVRPTRSTRPAAEPARPL